MICILYCILTVTKLFHGRALRSSGIELLISQGLSSNVDVTLFRYKPCLSSYGQNGVMETASADIGNHDGQHFCLPPEFVQGWGVTLCLSLQCLQLLDISLSAALNIQGEDSFQKKHLSKSTLDGDTCNIV